jgi:hypothetical protein
LVAAERVGVGKDGSSSKGTRKDDELVSLSLRKAGCMAEVACAMVDADSVMAIIKMMRKMTYLRV